MFDGNEVVLDECTWQIVYSFFHPEEDAGGFGSLFTGILSGPIGISGGSLPGAIAAPSFYSGRPACLVWAADEDKDEKNFWRAQIMVTSGLGFDESVIITVTDAQGENIDSAKLILLNSTLDVAEFQRNLKNTNVALIYPDGRRVPGTLSLNEDFV